MTSFYLALIAVLLAGIGARDQVTLARLTLAQGARPLALVLAVALAVATAAAAAVAASAIAPTMPPPARQVMAAMALVLAGGESLLIVPGRRKPAEPTRSLGALALVLAAQQLTDAPRFLVFAMGVGTGSPALAGAAGALSGAALMAMAWLGPEGVTHRAAGITRRVFGAVLLLVGLGLGLDVMGVI